MCHKNRTPEKPARPRAIVWIPFVPFLVVRTQHAQFMQLVGIFSCPQGTRCCCSKFMIGSEVTDVIKFLISKNLAFSFLRYPRKDWKLSKPVKFIERGNDKLVEMDKDGNWQDTALPIGYCSSSKVLNQLLFPFIKFTVQHICLLCALKLIGFNVVSSLLTLFWICKLF